MQNPFRAIGRLLRIDGGILDSKQAQIALMLGLVVITAGCMGIGDDDGASSPDAEIESVPADVDGVMFFDGGIATDQATTELMDGLLALGDDNLAPDDPESWDEVLEEAEDESDLDIGEFQSATVFFQVDDDVDLDAEEEYAGVILESNWEWDDLVDAAEGEPDEIESDTYNGVDVYFDPAEDDAWIADFGDGTFAAGSEEAVKDVIDTRAGDADPFSGELRDAYDGAGDGLMKAAVDISDEDFGGGDELPEPDIITMIYNTDGSEMNFGMGMTVDSEEEAEQLAEELNAELEQNPELALFSGDIEIGNDADQITFDYSTTPDEIVNMVEIFLGLGQAGGGGEFNSVQSPALTG